MRTKHEINIANDNPDPEPMTVLEAMEQLCEMIDGAEQVLLVGLVDATLEPTAKRNIKAMKKAVCMMSRHLQDLEEMFKIGVDKHDDAKQHDGDIITTPNS